MSLGSLIGVLGGPSRAPFSFLCILITLIPLHFPLALLLRLPSCIAILSLFLTKFIFSIKDFVLIKINIQINLSFCEEHIRKSVRNWWQMAYPRQPSKSTFLVFYAFFDSNSYLISVFLHQTSSLVFPLRLSLILHFFIPLPSSLSFFSLIFYQGGCSFLNFCPSDDVHRYSLYICGFARTLIFAKE